jgi:hypothetical protein
MKKSVLFIVVILIVNNIVWSQNKLTCMQGVWADIYNGENEYNEYGFTVIKENRSLSFVYADGKQELDFPLSESQKGFLDYNPVKKGTININELKENGLYYIVVNIKYIDEHGNVKYPDYLVPDYFECDNVSMSIGGNQLSEYVKIERLPSFALKLLYNRGNKDNRNYIKDYLNVEVREIKVAKSVIYSEPDNSTKMFFIKGDVVTVIDKKENWLKIEFLGTRLVRGWIKDDDIK